MATLHELRSQIEQGKTTVLFLKDKDGENVKAFIRKDVQGRYIHKLSRPDLPNPFPRPETQSYSSWEHLLADIEGLQATSDQWNIE